MLIDFIDETQRNEYIDWVITENKHKYYDKTVEHAKQMSVHINGDLPGELLTSYRPNEPKEIRDYRLSIYQPITKSSSKRALNVISRISNSKYYSITFPEQPNVGEDTLQKYALEDYPYFDNIVKWLFDIVLKQMMSDPNAVVAVAPIKYDIDDTQRFSPFANIYRSDQVIDYYPDNRTTILLDEKSLVEVGAQKLYEGDIFLIFTDNEIIELKQVGKKHDRTFEETILLTHDLETTPTFRLGGEFIDGSFPFMFESFMSGILPFWNDAIREFSDKQATFVQHVYLERVEMQVKCDNNCSPQRELDGAYGLYIGEDCVECTRCSGSGFISGRSPYGVTVVRESEDMTDGKIQFPGVQYIDKPTEIVTLLKEDIDQMIKSGFEAINMDIIANVGENQSGVAKTIDRSDLDGFLMSISDRVFAVLKSTLDFINYFRYNKLPNYADYRVQISKPTNFDVLTSQMLADTLKAAKDSKLSSHLIDELEKDYVNKQFGSNELLREKHTLYIELDPMSNLTEDVKFSMLGNRGVTKQAYVVSSNIKQFVNRAIEEDASFLELTRKEQTDILRRYADEQITAQPTFNIIDEDGQ